MTVPSPARIGLVAVGVATFFALVSASQTYLAMLDHGHSYWRILAWQFGCWAQWALVAPWIVSRGAHWSVGRLLALGALLTVVQGLAAAQFAIWFRPYTPVAEYTFLEALQLFGPVRMVVGPLAFGLLVAGGKAFAAYDRAKRLELRESQLQAEVTRAQLDALSLEIQPHFLFNTLNSIAALIRLNDNRGALDMLLGLSELMRSTLERSPDQVAPLAQEVAVVRRYVDIQRARFGDRLQVAYQIDAVCNRAEVPLFLLQPLVENAIRHGMGPGTGVCHVEIGAVLHDGDTIRVWVSDDGAGLPPGFDLAANSGTGLRNTSSRISRLYLQAASFVVRPNHPTGTLVELTLPHVTAPPSRTPAAHVA